MQIDALQGPKHETRAVESETNYEGVNNVYDPKMYMEGVKSTN